MSNGEKEFYEHWDSVSAAYGFGSEYGTAHMAAKAAWAAQASTIVALKEREVGLEAALGIASKAAAALKEQVASARNDALEEAAQACDDRSQREPYGHAKAACGLDAEAIRALASQPAAPVQPITLRHGFLYAEGLDIKAVSYVDEINGTQTCLDDLWLATTEALNALRAPVAAVEAAPPVQQPCDVREKKLTLGRFGELCDMLPADFCWGDGLTPDVLEDILSAALATTRPSAALTDERAAFEAWSAKWKYNLKPARAESLDTYMEGETETAWMGWEARAILAASSGAVAVPEGWQPIETAPKDRKIDLWTGEARLTGCYWDRACGEWRKTDESGHIIRTRVATYWREIPAAPATPAQGQTK